MRNLSANLTRKLASHVQAGDSAISANIWVGRPTTQLIEDVFLEKQKIPFGSNVTKVSAAVRRPRIMRDATDIFVGYIDNGTASVVRAAHDYRIENHEWFNTNLFSEAAEDISLCFDGTMPKNVKGTIEFVTEDMPWVFWVSNATLRGRKLDSDEAVTLAEANCSAVSAIRAMWSDVGNFDFGMVVFFIIGGYLYYRQYINGVWYDAEVVNAGPTGVLWKDVSAFRTWDYRVGVQLVAQDGTIHELYTQFMGIGRQSTEHVEIFAATRNKGKLTGIEYHTFRNDEHMSLSDAENITPYQGIWSLGVPSLVDVYNIDDGTGDWGKKVVFKFDKELEYNSVQASIGSFYFTDSADTWYFPSTIEMDVTGRRAILTYVNINNAVGECVAHYEPGTVVTMMEEVLAEQTLVFTPKNLIPNDNVPPEVVDIWNMNEIGTKVAIRFSEPLVAAPPESAEKFIVTIAEPVYSPGGALFDSIKPVISVGGYVGMNNAINLAEGTTDGISSSGGKLRLEVMPDE